jgi:hypothetical protein
MGQADFLTGSYPSNFTFNAIYGFLGLLTAQAHRTGGSQAKKVWGG